MTALVGYAVCCLFALMPAGALGNEGSSPSVAKDLVSAMTARQMDAIAAPDPDEPGRFVAALVFPGVQMLVVTARYPSPERLQQMIARRQFREAYSELQEGTATNRLFFHDMGCDGLGTESDGADVLYEGSTAQTVFDGKWDAQSLTASAYAEKFKTADERYTRVLTVLLSAVKRLPVGTHD